MNKNIDEYIIDYNLIELFSYEYLKENFILPIEEKNLYLLFAIYDENTNLDELQNKINKPIKTIQLEKNIILQKLHLYTIKKDLYNLADLSLKKTQENDSYIDKFLKLLVECSLELNSSDIHIESLVDTLIIRIRIDGILKHIISLKKVFISMLSSYIKLKANLDISLKRRPQDSRFSLYIKEKKYDFRVSTMPTIEGESIVLRILENNTIENKLSKLGFDSKSFNILQKDIQEQNGLILITGPTGSGKTTTLYSIIKELNTCDKKIITIEDPVEYKIPKVQQISINNTIGLSFEKVLKNILRQDPDIILIGEIRDKESLKIAIQASLTGHLVFATLHTNNALNTINRVLDLGGEPFLLSSTLKTIISQRLVRKLCSCKKFDAQTNSYIKHGCELCNFDGFKGRVMIYEMINIDEEISSMISLKKNTDKILKYLNKNQYVDIISYAKTLVKNGITTNEEIFKVI